MPRRPAFVRTRTWHGYALVLCTTLFVTRVAGQAIQFARPLQSLPPFDAWQGSSASYPLLLAAQGVIVIFMARITWQVFQLTLQARRRVGWWLAAFGTIYATGSVVRLMVGVLVDDAPAWFSAWIPGVFHLVLAAFVLILSHFHIAGATRAPLGP